MRLSIKFYLLENLQLPIFIFADNDYSNYKRCTNLHFTGTSQTDTTDTETRTRQDGQMEVKTQEKNRVVIDEKPHRAWT